MRSLATALVGGGQSTVESLIALFKSDRPVSELSAELEKHDARDIIEAAIAVFGKDAAVSTAFGAGGLCVMDIAQKLDPEVRAFYIDTGFGFDETETLAQRWVNERRLNLLRVLPELTPEEQAAEHGDELWRSDPDKCCELRKVEPNNRALEGVKLWIAALRRDESASRKKTPILQEVTLPSGHTLLKLSPIAKWTKKEVWSYIVEHELPYNELHDRGYPSIGCTHCTRPVREGGDEREGRWAGTNKLECGLHVPQIQRKECC
jgi:phosphoadenosine phosphosulfate reductase